MRLLTSLLVWSALSASGSAFGAADAQFRFTPSGTDASGELRVVMTPGQFVYDPTCLAAIDAPTPEQRSVEVLEVHGSEVGVDGALREWNAYFEVRCDSRAISLEMQDLHRGATYSATTVLGNSMHHEMWTTPKVTSPEQAAPPAVAH